MGEIMMAKRHFLMLCKQNGEQVCGWFGADSLMQYKA
jgi:hypothetical protein